MSLLIDISSLAWGVHEFEVEPSADDVGLDENTFSAIRVALQIDSGERRLSVKLSAEAIASLTCDRTLVQFNQRIEGDFFVIYERDDTGEDESGELRHISPVEQSIDIAPDVRDTLLLAVPLRKVAPEADGVELTLNFGSPDKGSVDPRWKALEALRSKQ